MLQALQAQQVPILGGLLLSLALYAAFRAFTNPVSRVPGPWHSKITNVVSKYKWIAGQKIYWIEALHRQYGPIVRVSPTEVSITGLDAVKSVYTVKETFRKSDWYTGVVTTKTPSVFSAIDVDYHRRHRRALAGPMAESSLKQMMPAVLAKVDLVMQRMQEELKERGCIDVYKWWMFMTTDTIGELTFGSSFRMLETGKENQYTRDLQAVAINSTWRGAYPTLANVCGLLGLPHFRAVQDRAKRMRQYAVQSLKRYEDRIANDTTTAASAPTLFTKIFKAQDEDKMTMEEIIINSQSYLVAGTDTTSNTLTYLVWTLCSQPSIRDELVAELRTLPDDYEEKDLRALPYLDGVIHESLRCFSVAGATLPRTVPPEGTELEGFFLPGGTTVGTQGFSMHRLADVFPQPEVFDPRRWANPTKDMKDAFMAFGRGSRVCLGQHLAEIELRLATAKFFLTFPNATVSNKEGMTAGDMVPIQYFLLKPSGDRCLVQA